MSILEATTLDSPLCKNVRRYLEYKWDTTLDPPCDEKKLESFILKPELLKYLTTVSSTYGKTNVVSKLFEDGLFNGFIDLDHIVPGELMYILEVFQSFKGVCPLFTEGCSIQEIPGVPTFYSCKISDTNHHGDILFGIQNISEGPVTMTLGGKLSAEIKPGEFVMLPPYFANDPTTAYSLSATGDCVTCHVLLGAKLAPLEPNDCLFLQKYLFSPK
jgi:hypothetical protein